MSLAKRFDLWLFLGCVMLFVALPQGDIAFSGLFFDAADNRFPLALSEPLHELTEAFDEVQYVLLAGILGTFAVAFALPKPRRGRVRRSASFLLLLLLLVPGLLVNGVFKEQFGRARPEHIEAFGGDHQFSRAFAFTDQCDTNCSFTSGHAAISFYFIAFAFLFRDRPRWFRALFVLGFAIGLVVGGTRVLQGRHFLSDILFSFWFVYGGAQLLAAWLLPRREPTPADPA